MSIIFVCFYLHITVVIFVDYSDMGKIRNIFDSHELFDDNVLVGSIISLLDE
jgi:hypothetical protein